eukprot:TRINITY_DN183_c0_g3_i1.p1 TRINITY_DN183_c0_g3~~TRINITY_DN183_c0_g3_i1.p1  ORF type:complete len:269 (+),score=69.33 TRINITY_DN183_c0_g3_i1:59-865(+)
MNKFIAIVLLGSLLTPSVFSDGVHGRHGSSNRRGRQDGPPPSSYGAPLDTAANNAAYDAPLSGYGAQPTYDSGSQPTYDGGLDTAANTAEGGDDNLAMLEKSVPGIPGEDYPIYAEVPESGFECEGQVDGGYYADPEAECQVFHICTADGAGSLAKYSFLCPNGTIFNQNYFICDWWFNFDCSQAEELYSKNEEIAAEREAASPAIEAVEAAQSGYGSPSGSDGEAPLSGYGIDTSASTADAPLDTYAAYDSDRSGRSRFQGSRRFRN